MEESGGYNPPERDIAEGGNSLSERASTEHKMQEEGEKGREGKDYSWW